MNKSCKVTGIGFDYLFDTAAPSIPPSMGWKAQIPPSPCHITEENFVRSPDLEDDDKVTFDFFLFHDPAEGYSRDQLYQICASISSDFWYNLVGLEFKYATSGRSCRSRCYGTQLSSLEKVCFDIDGAGGEYIEKIVHFQCMGPAASVVEFHTTKGRKLRCASYPVRSQNVFQVLRATEGRSIIGLAYSTSYYKDMKTTAALNFNSCAVIEDYIKDV